MCCIKKVLIWNTEKVKFIMLNICVHIYTHTCMVYIPPTIPELFFHQPPGYPYQIYLETATWVSKPQSQLTISFSFLYDYLKSLYTLQGFSGWDSKSLTPHISVTFTDYCPTLRRGTRQQKHVLGSYGTLRNHWNLTKEHINPHTLVCFISLLLLFTSLFATYYKLASGQSFGYQYMASAKLQINSHIFGCRTFKVANHFPWDACYQTKGASGLM